MSKGEQGEQGEDENNIKSEAPTFTFLSLPSTTISIFFSIVLPATMGRKALTLKDRIALARERGYSTQTSSIRQNQLS